jgi:outer membrane protein OmpA-like peptidoglycan-associated protein
VLQAIASVSVSPPTASINAAGGRVPFTAQATDANGRPVTGKVITWTLSAPAVASLSPTGVATAVANGTAQITATVEGRAGSAVLTVAIPRRAAPAPAPVAAAALPAVNATVVLRNVIFRPNSAVLPPEALGDLDAVAQAMKAIPNARWEIGGFTSNMGTATRNQLLSRRRALAVRNYLVRQGVRAASLSAVGYGPQNPVASNATVAGRRQNMRVEIKRLR